MTSVLWVAVVVLATAVVFLVFALNGATRTVAELRRSLDSWLDQAFPATGRPIGSSAPDIHGAPFRGTRHLVVFADPGCAACETLVPSLLASEDLRPLVIVGRSEDGWPDTWRSPTASIVFDPDQRTAAVYTVQFTPEVFVIDEHQGIVARGPADTVEKVRELEQQSRGITTVVVPQEFRIEP